MPPERDTCGVESDSDHSIPISDDMDSIKRLVVLKGKIMQKQKLYQYHRISPTMKHSRDCTQ
jgi:hypothetical protein